MSPLASRDDIAGLVRHAGAFASMTRKSCMHAFLALSSGKQASEPCCRPTFSPTRANSGRNCPTLEESLDNLRPKPPISTKSGPESTEFVSNSTKIRSTLAPTLGQICRDFGQLRPTLARTAKFGLELTNLGPLSAEFGQMCFARGGGTMITLRTRCAYRDPMRSAHSSDES